MIKRDEYKTPSVGSLDTKRLFATTLSKLVGVNVFYLFESVLALVVIVSNP